MYLKTIEIHGFKSFANRIVLRFQDGIAAIVGPNGSGKSNVADAVRWVLGEQSAKQLRGSRMEDVIFSGTQLRKSMGYAYVALTLDNSDHKLPLDYEEVTVARRVYRSGESEYLLNGAVCRLRDVQELFLDTGIGKEGYSIIGQGQIDRILSGKPEERRELFDEAAGIVKYKKRKAAAEKELAEEQGNLSRITDILSEIEKQVGPLQKQSEVAKEYLRLRDALRRLEVNLFLLDYERSETMREELKKKEAAVSGDLEETRRSYDSTKQEYERLETELENISKSMEQRREQKTELLVQIQKRDGEIRLMQEKIASLQQSDAQYGKRAKAAGEEEQARRDELDRYRIEQQEMRVRAEEAKAEQETAAAELSEKKQRIEELTRSLEECNARIVETLRQDTETKAKLQHYETLSEQAAIRKSELAKRLFLHKTEEAELEADVQKAGEQVQRTSAQIEELSAGIRRQEEELLSMRAELDRLGKESEQAQRSQIEEASRLEALRNLTERYEGYGNSIRKVMEKKREQPGILGVVADLIHVDAKYETAIETALGASIQNIVTKDETTAKRMVDYLKVNKLGRATFLPLTSITAKAFGALSEQALSEPGVIGRADTLVRADDAYAELRQYLLGRILVVDTMEHALVLARKYAYSLRIVTLEGEQLNPGGSISGGAYRNNSNLLGRRREMEDREKKIAGLKQKVAGFLAQREELRGKRDGLRSQTEEEKERLQALRLEQNTEELELSQAKERLDASREAYARMEQEAQALEAAKSDHRAGAGQLAALLEQNGRTRQEAEEEIRRGNAELEQERAAAAAAEEQVSGLLLSCATMEQNLRFSTENVTRVESELEKLKEEKEQLAREAGEARKRRKDQEDGIRQATEDVEAWNAAVEGLEQELIALERSREGINKGHRSFFEKREGLSERISALDKELFRLNGQKERLEESMDAQCNYMWEEYELTLETAKEYRDPAVTNYSATKKAIGEHKAGIKALGDVNVNAIEDYRVLSERYELYSTQKEDLLTAEASLRTIILELDEEMRKQFSEKFSEIREQFDVVFRELFGGGKGTLELMEDEDILTAGIRIIAQPPGKKLQNMMQLSGGEKALTAIALLFSIQNLKPSPFCLLDEIEAALDDSNVGRYANYLRKLTKHTQFIVITHRRGTMAVADVLYGITMQEKGVSTLVSVSLIENDLEK